MGNPSEVRKNVNTSTEISLEGYTFIPPGYYVRELHAPNNSLKSAIWEGYKIIPSYEEQTNIPIVEKSTTPERSRRVILKEVSAYDVRHPDSQTTEARLTALAQNFPSVGVIDFLTYDGDYFLVLEDLREERITLRERISGPIIPLSEMRLILSQLCAQIDRLARISGETFTGVFHWDIKPSNIYVPPSSNDTTVLHPLYASEPGAVMTIDYGLSTTNDPDIFSMHDYEAPGTTSYSTPERQQHRTKVKLALQSEVYSVGAVLYEMITKAPYVEGESESDRVAAVINANPDDLETDKNLRNWLRILLREGGPAPIEPVPDDPRIDAVIRVLMKALAKNPDDRYSTAMEFSRAFDAAITAAEPISEKRE